MSGAFPSGIGIAHEVVKSQHITLVSEGQSLKQQVRAKTGHKWVIEIDTPPLEEADWRTLFAFLVSQRGRYDTFTYIPQTLKTPRGAGGGTPLVNGGSQTGRSLVTDGWPNSTAVLKAGDVLKIQNTTKIYMVTSDVTSDGSGNATISIEPALVSSPADNETITITNVPFTVALTSDTAELDVDVAMLAGLSLVMEERP